MRFPRQGFGAILKVSTGDRVDTVRGQVTKDLVGRRDTTIAMPFTGHQLDQLYECAIRDRLFDLPEPHPARELFLIQPSLGIRLELRAGGVVRRFEWDRIHPPEPTRDAWARLRTFVVMLDSMATNHASYKALPAARRAYF
ncbi:MAG: hypothetical protein ABI565_05970 [Vicinamibacteria bacterium]